MTNQENRQAPPSKERERSERIGSFHLFLDGSTDGGAKAILQRLKAEIRAELAYDRNARTNPYLRMLLGADIGGMERYVLAGEGRATTEMDKGFSDSVGHLLMGTRPYRPAPRVDSKKQVKKENI